VKGRAAEVDILEEGAGFVLSIGAVSVWLGPALAVDVLDTLARAIAAAEPPLTEEAERDAPPPRPAPRRRVFS